ncbi:MULTISPECIES: M1 family metallopeptidase [unclassified Brevundimonas]|uniref:M1 family metallopeptidase n=1 Tax=unclassified Brevundimonas TaxID=2622653 RepID=UPI003F9227CF
MGAREREVLPANARPERYAIELSPNLDTLTFTAKARLAFQVLQATDRITVNAVDLTFIKAGLVDGGAVARIETDPALERVSFVFDRPLAPGDHVIEVAYGGKINESATGLFVSRYQMDGVAKTMLMSQFEAGYARQFAPIWDEPGLKAVFELALVVPDDLDAVSNMPVASVAPGDAGMKRVTFQPSPKMSSYLMFVGVGEMDRITTTVAGVEIGSVTRRGVGEQGRYALGALGQILPFYNDYFGTAFPLPKLDQIAAPGAGTFGAMENWGAILYFERVMLVDPALTTEADKQYVYVVVAHEVSHQWFGNLVTMDWWDDLWLNEGFASWMKNKATDAFNPDWNIWLQTQSTVDQAMALDSLTGTHPIVQRLSTIREVDSAFDQITYQKGQAVIRMLEAYLGEAAFRDGIRAYMAESAYGNTVTEDLWRSLEAHSDTPVTAVARDFTTQAGVPLITVGSIRCDAGTSVVALTQSRFGADESSRAPQTWRVPVMIQTVGSDVVARAVIENGHAEVRVPGCGPVKVNAGSTGYFRTAYPAEAMARLEAAFGELSGLDQIGLLNDAWALGAAGYSPASNYLALAASLENTADPMIWNETAGTLATLADLYDGQAGEAAFDAFARDRLSPLLAQISWEVQPGEPANAAILRERLIGVLSMLDDPAVIAEARRRYAAADADPSALPAGLRNVVIRVVGAHADAATFDDLLQRSQTAASPLERSLYQTALTRALDPALGQRAIDLAFNSQTPAQDAFLMVANLIWRHSDLLWDKTMADATRFQEITPEGFQVALLSNMAAESRRPGQIDLLRAYVTANYPGAPLGEVEQAASKAALDHRIQHDQLPEVTSWLNSDKSVGRP